MVGPHAQKSSDRGKPTDYREAAMQADLWTAFTFFGLPLALGILGVVRGVRLCARGYLEYSTGRPVDGVSRSPADDERSWRENLLIGALLVLGAGLLVAHSGRWLLRIL